MAERYQPLKKADLGKRSNDENFVNNILVVAGDEWHGGNLSYHLNSRPIWDNILENKNNNLDKLQNSFVLVGDISILKKICTAVFIEIENQGFWDVPKDDFFIVLDQFCLTFGLHFSTFFGTPFFQFS